MKKEAAEMAEAAEQYGKVAGCLAAREGSVEELQSIAGAD